MSQTKAQLIASTKRTKKYAGLINIGLTEDAALAQLGVGVAEDTRVADLVAAGFSQVEAEGIVGTTTDGAMSAVTTPASPLTNKDLGDALVAQHGLAFTRGRVYVTPSILEAAVRTLKGGGAEIVATSGVGRSVAVLVFKVEESGDVALQNLAKPV